MNIKKKGFTLIELLAVIVILAVIALIATPVIFNTIEKSKKGSFEQTLINIGKGVKLYKAKVELDEDLEECRYFSFSDDVTEVTKKEGKTYYPLKELSLKGNLPIEGEIKVCDETIAINAGNGSYSGRYEDGETTVVKGELADNDLQSPVIDIFNVTPKRNAIVVVVSAHSQKQDGTIANYYYKIDDGDYIKTTEQSHVFEGLEPKTEYTITVMVENSYGIKTKMFKQVTTVNFGELTIDVEKPNEWTSSKNVTIKETSDEYKTEYKIRKYNEETKEIEESEFLEYTDSFTLDTIATTEYPILIIARYNDNGTYSDEKTYTVVNIDTTSPTNTKPVVNVSTTKPTSEASVVIRQDDAESGLDESTIEYGYSLDNVTYTWQASSELKKLKSGTTYYVKTRVTNNVGKTMESEIVEYTPGEISTCSVEILTSGWATSKNVKITGTQTGVELQYQVGSTSESGWTTIDNEGTVTVEENTNVYCRLWDGTNSGSGTGIVEGIDREEPDLELKTEELTTNSVVIPYEATDTGSGPSTATCEYGTSTKYGNDGTINSNNNACTISGLTSETTYYYRICVSDKVGNGPVCKEGNTKPASMESPKILFDNTPDNSVNEYYKEQTAQVTYITTGITNPRYFVKTDRTGTSNLTVINKCGNDTNPKIEECTGATGTTLTEGIWYEVNGNVNVTYDTAASENGLIYATIYDGTNFITPAPTGTLSKIDRTNPKLTLIRLNTTTNSTHIGISSSDTETGISEVTCKYSDKEGSYTENGSIYGNNMTCAIIGLKPEVTYYYQICVSDGVGNGPVCEEGSTSTKSMPKPKITFTNTPETAVNGYLESQVAHVTYTATGITSPRYFVKTTRAGVSSLTVTNKCGTGNIPTTSCETITGTTTLSANTWYEVSGNLDVTYNEYSATNGEIFAAIYDGTNFIDPIPSGTLMKITKETNYTVRHYQMNTDMTNYTLAETETLSGKIGYPVRPSVKTYTGFNSPVIRMVTVEKDGSTVVDYHYSRKQVMVSFHKNDSTMDMASQTFIYGVSGQRFSAKGWSRTGYTLVGWAKTASGPAHYEPLNWVSNGWINENAPITDLYAVWVKNPTVTFAHTPSTLQNGYAKSSVATVTYSSTNVTSPVYYIKTTRAGTSSVAVTQSCGTGSSPGTCTTITSTTSLAANTWYKISGNTKVTYNTAASSTGTLYAYTYDGTTAKAQGSGTIPMIDTASPTITLGATTSTTDSITINYGIGDVSGIGSYTCSYGKEDPPYISSGNASYGSNASSVSTTKCTLSNLLPNKEYYYRICATDKVGNVSACKTGTTKTLLVKNVNSSGTTYFSSLQKAINNAISSKLATTVTLMDNTDGNVSINDGVENDNVVVDFNGKTLTGTILDFNLSSSLTLKNGTISGGIDRAIYNEGLLYIQNMTLKSETTEFNEAVWNTATGHIDMTDTNIISGTTYALKNSSTSTVNRINYPNTITGKIKGNVLMVVKTTTGVQFRIFGKTVTACTASVSSNGKSATYNASSTTNSYGTYYYCDINKANHGNATGKYSISVINNGSLVIGTTFEMR